MLDALTRATQEITDEHLKWMVLDREQLPTEFSSFEVFREGVLDNQAMVEQGFPGNTAESFRAYGRITGYLKELVSPVSPAAMQQGINIATASVVHLFESKEAVTTWIAEVFVKQFEEHEGKPVTHGQRLVSVKRLPPAGFHDTCAAMAAYQEGPRGKFSSTVVDFRVGRILGVAFVVSTGQVERLEAAERIGGLLERQIVRVVLGGR